MKYYIVDAFTDEPFGGNPAGVVLLDGDFPSDELMQQVAAELRYSETVFVQQQDYNEFTMRYFTMERINNYVEALKRGIDRGLEA